MKHKRFNLPQTGESCFSQTILQEVFFLLSVPDGLPFSRPLSDQSPINPRVVKSSSEGWPSGTFSHLHTESVELSWSRPLKRVKTECNCRNMRTELRVGEGASNRCWSIKTGNGDKVTHHYRRNRLSLSVTSNHHNQKDFIPIKKKKWYFWLDIQFLTFQRLLL